MIQSYRELREEAIKVVVRGIFTQCVTMVGSKDEVNLAVSRKIEEELGYSGAHVISAGESGYRLFSAMMRNANG